MVVKNYVCSTPKKIVFGDPMYFEDYADNKEELKRLTIDLNVSRLKEDFSCLVSIVKNNFDDIDGDFYELVISLVSNGPMGLYVSGMKYTNQKSVDDAFGVDTASYYLAVDDRDDEFSTGADGYWATKTTYTSNKNKDAIVIAISMPEYLSEKEIDDYIHYYFSDLEECTINPKTYNVKKLK